jgi:hypothetical protein
VSKLISFFLVEAKQFESFSNYIVWEIKLIVILNKEKLWDVIEKAVSSTRLFNG